MEVIMEQLYERLEYKPTLKDLQINHVKDFLCGLLCKIKHVGKLPYGFDIYYDNGKGYQGCIMMRGIYITQDGRQYNIPYGDMMYLINTMPTKVPENLTGIKEVVKTSERVVILAGKLSINDINKYCVFLNDFMTRYFYYDMDYHQLGFRALKRDKTIFLPLCEVDKLTPIEIMRIRA